MAQVARCRLNPSVRTSGLKRSRLRAAPDVQQLRCSRCERAVVPAMMPAKAWLASFPSVWGKSKMNTQTYVSGIKSDLDYLSVIRFGQF